MRELISERTPLGTIEIVAESNGDLSLTRGELPKSIANGMTIDHSVACVLSVSPVSDATDVIFSGKLLNSQLEGTGATGEGLDCIEWETQGWHLTLGTEDQEMLNHRLPELNITAEPYPIEYSASKISLHLQNLPIRIVTTFHLIISYKQLPDERICSAWYFADIPHEIALKTVQSQHKSNPVSR